MRSSTWSPGAEVKLEVIPDARWASEIARRLLVFVAANPQARICLPTGKTVEPVYAELAGSQAMAGATVFLLDEFGGLPEDDPARCVNMINRHLLDHLGARPAMHVPAVDPPDPDGYQALVSSGGLDLAILGLGANGHIGMNEPGSTIDSPTRVVELAATTSEHAALYGATAPPSWGVTLGMAQLIDAAEVWVVVTGAHKREILRKAIEGPMGPDVPASLLREHPNLTVLADESAAGAG